MALKFAGIEMAFEFVSFGPETAHTAMEESFLNTKSWARVQKRIL